MFSVVKVNMNTQATSHPRLSEIGGWCKRVFFLLFFDGADLSWDRYEADIHDLYDSLCVYLKTYPIDPRHTEQDARSVETLVPPY